GSDVCSADLGGEERPQGGGQRPWGSAGGGRDNRPQGPRRGDQIPEIEELVRKGQDRLRVLMGGKGGGGGNRGGGPRRPQGPQFQMSRGTWGIAALAVLAVWAFSSFYTVKPEERAVELLFGKPVGTGEPGLNFAPWPVVTAEVVQVSGERTTEIGTGR